MSNYLRVFLTLARNSLVRDMTFRANFLINTFTSVAWVFINLGFYTIIFQYTPAIGANTGWEKYQFFLFISTGLVINSLVQALFMTNADELSELVRSGMLDFALLKPIDTQFLVSFTRIEWCDLGISLVGLGLMGYSMYQLHYMPGLVQIVLYPLYVVCGVAIYYSLMIALAATSVWLGRNQNLFDFWFYITNFSRYPMEIYEGRWGTPLRYAFTFLIPVLVVVNVPARILVRPLDPQTPGDWLLPGFTILAAVATRA
jgi:ABC-2 type transport system permease protein